MAVRVIVGGEIKSFSEGEVEVVGGEREFFWHAKLYSPYFEPYLVILSRFELPKGVYIVKGGLSFSKKRPVVVAEKLYWGGKLSLCCCTATVRKTLVRGELYLCRAEGIPFLFRQTEGIPLERGESVILEGELHGKRSNRGWELTLTGKPVL